MSECDFYIHAIVDDVAVGFYVEASSHTEASNEAIREAQRRFPGKRVEIRGVEKLPIFQFRLKPPDRPPHVASCKVGRDKSRSFF